MLYQTGDETVDGNRIILKYRNLNNIKL